MLSEWTAAANALSFVTDIAIKYEAELRLNFIMKRAAQNVNITLLFLSRELL